MKREDSLPNSQQNVTDPYPEPDASNLHLFTVTIHSNINFMSKPRSSEWFLPFRFSDQNLYAFFKTQNINI